MLGRESLVTKITVYTKAGCYLCENVILQLRKLQSERPFAVETRDITEDAELYERYGNVIPVVEIDGKIRLGGSTLADHSTLESVLRKALFSV